MLDDDFKLYCQQNLDLARSIVIKCDVASRLINNNLLSLGELVDLNDPSTWKYYLNLNGQYYVGNSTSTDTSDEVMTILSPDDGTVIDYTKSNLSANSLIYASFDSFKDRLVESYPKQENLIYYIKDPIDINVAINAEDFTILSYDRSLVASNEESLMSKIQKWIHDFKDRWYKEDFQISNPYYVASFLATMYIKMPQAIMNFRLEACGSAEVDQFHLWNYLGDHYELNKYRDSLSITQSLWLYRNMVDIQRNAGKQWVLESLITNLAVPKGLSANKFDFIKKDSGSILNGRPDGEYLIRDYFDNTVDLDDQPIASPQEMLYKTRDKAKKNRIELEADQQELSDKGYYETNPEFPVGLLEFEVSNASLSSLANDVKHRIEYWMYLSSLNMYEAQYTFEIPNTGNIILTPKDAYILYEYARFARNGIHTDNVRSYVARGVVSFDPAISVAHFRSHVPVDRVPDEFIVDTLADRIPNITVTSPATLESYAEKVIQRRLRHELSYNYITDKDLRPHYENVIEGVYDDVTCTLEPSGTTYDDWLANKKIRRLSMANADWDTVMLDLLFQCTGIDPDNVGIGLSKRHVIEIIDRLTSYSTLIVDGNSANLVERLPFPFIYPSGTKSSKVLNMPMDLGNIRLFDERSGNSSKKLSSKMDFMHDEVILTSGNSSKLGIDYCMDVDIGFRHSNRTKVGIPGMSISNDDA